MRGAGGHRVAGAVVDRRRARAASGLCLLVYAGLSIAIYWGISPLDGRHLPVCGCLDPVQTAWFLNWDLSALWHGHNPFFSAAIDYPHGIDVAANTSMPLLALLAAPVTVLAGPVAAVNLWFHLAFFTSAAAAFAVLRRWGMAPGAAFVGGLFYGFSPYLVGQGAGHVNLVLVPLLPVLAYLIGELVLGRSAHPRRSALLLGAVAAAQFLVSPEILADFAVVAVITALLVALTHPGALRRHAARSVLALGWALVVFLPISAAELWALMFGPQHITGAVSPEVAKGLVRADLLGAVVPDRLMRFATPAAIHESSSFIMGNLVENGSYLGLPLLVLLVAIVAWAWRDRRVSVAAAVAVIAFVLSLGNVLTIDAKPTKVTMPFRLLMYVPELRNITASRFSGLTDLAVAGLLAFGLDRALGARWRASRWPWRTAAYGVVALSLLPLVPRSPYPVASTAVPAFFTSRDVDVIPEHGLVLAYPYPYSPTDQAMLWQAESGFRFTLFGGYALAPSPRGGGTYNPPSPVPGALRQFFRSGLSTRPVTFAELDQDPAAVRASACGFFRTGHVAAVVIDPNLSVPPIFVQAITLRRHLDASIAIQLMRTLTGEGPIQRGEIDLWLDPATHCSTR